MCTVVLIITIAVVLVKLLSSNRNPPELGHADVLRKLAFDITVILISH